jgi:hypothetical protein
MQKRTLYKRRLPGRGDTCGRAKVYAYEGDFRDACAALADSMMHGGVVASDTLRFDPISIDYSVRSPISVTSDSTGTRVGVSAGLQLDVGISIGSRPSQGSSGSIFGENQDDQIEGMKRTMMVGM